MNTMVVYFLIYFAAEDLDNAKTQISKIIMVNNHCAQKCIFDVKGHSIEFSREILQYSYEHSSMMSSVGPEKGWATFHSSGP